MTLLSGLLHYALQLRGTFSPARARICIFCHWRRRWSCRYRSLSGHLRATWKNPYLAENWRIL